MFASVWLVAGLALLLVVAWLVGVHAAAGDAGHRGSVLIGPAAPAVAAPSRSAVASATGVAPQPTEIHASATQIEVDRSWALAIAGRTGIPARAVVAYADAQFAADATQPKCHLAWTMLAGIGSVESGHGSHGGATLRDDGTTSIPILGPALDGTHGNIAVHATSEGLRLDGDPQWDHAVGPMQFIPSTWARWGVSTDGGVPNPNDIDDATLTAANYLCRAGGDLATVAGWRAAIAAYNAPDAYAVEVTDAANRYASESLG
jgi:membrane-bound lytic murein transglycosylase B